VGRLSLLGRISSLGRRKEKEK
jgi:hypothetical protein